MLISVMNASVLRLLLKWRRVPAPGYAEESDTQDHPELQ